MYQVGSTTVKATAIATAASTALPPAQNISMPAIAAKGWLVATDPCLPITTRRREANG